MVKEQIFKKEYALELLGIAEGDLRSSRVLLKDEGGRAENVCFHAQQAIEKGLKALLCHLEIAVPFTHNLEVLASKLPKSFTLPAIGDFETLAEYATIRRYEEGVVELDKKDLELTYKAASDFIAWVKKKIALAK